MFAVKDPQAFFDTLKNDYQFKIKEAKPLKFYFGVDFLRDEEGVLCMALQKYIEQLVATYENMFGEKPSAKMYFPLEKEDYPELDDSKLLNATGIQHYQLLIGPLQWAILLGQLDIDTAVMSMSCFCALPCQGHLKFLHHICGYLVKMKAYIT